jgi:hypothetical protein
MQALSRVDLFLLFYFTLASSHRTRVPRTRRETDLTWLNETCGQHFIAGECYLFSFWDYLYRALPGVSKTRYAGIRYTCVTYRPHLATQRILERKGLDTEKAASTFAQGICFPVVVAEIARGVSRY